MIEELDRTSRPEMVELFMAAFRDHPLLPSDPTGRKARLMATSILDAFADATDAHWFGIRRNGKLDCASFVFDAAYEPGIFALMLFLFRLVRVAGLRMTFSFFRVLSAKPATDERQLELMLLGTRAGCQGQGLGRAMIRHVFEFARSQGYRAVVLEVAKETPAFAFYQHEGFVVEKEVALPTMPLCLVRRPLDEHAAEDEASDGTG